MKIKKQTGYIVQLANPRHSYLNLDTIRYSARGAKAAFLQAYHPHFKDWRAAYKQGWRCVTVEVTLKTEEKI